MPDNGIDWGRITQDEGYKTKPYVVGNNQGGVTLLKGIDLGQANNASKYADFAIDAGASEQEQAALEKILAKVKGKSGAQATEALQSLSDQEMSWITDFNEKYGQGITSQWQQQSEQQIRNLFESAGGNWEELSSDWKTVYASAYHQYGNRVKNFNLTSQLVNGEEEAAIANLKDWGDRTDGFADAINARYKRYGEEIEQKQAQQEQEALEQLEQQATSSNTPPPETPPVEESRVQESAESEVITPCPCDVPPTTSCTVLSITAACEHEEREAKEEQILGVVPGSSMQSDTITLKAETETPCGKHPLWEITGDEQAQSKGAEYSLQAKPPVTEKLWIPLLSPNKYMVSSRGCHGSPKKLEVHCYPGVILSVNLDLNKLLRKIRKVTDAVEDVLEVAADKFSWKYLQGKARVIAMWKEYEDHRAYYFYFISAEFAPLISGNFKITFGPSKITKLVRKIPYLGKYVAKVIDWLIKAGVYVQLSGGIGLHLRFLRESPDQGLFVSNTAPGFSGEISLVLGVEGAVLGSDVISVHLSGDGALRLTGNGEVDQIGAKINYTLDFTGVKGTCKVMLLWGLIDINETITLIEGIPGLLGPEDIYIYKGEKGEGEPTALPEEDISLPSASAPTR